MSQNMGSASPRWQRLGIMTAGGLLTVAVALQFVRFIVPDFKLDNPPVTSVIQWDSPQTEQLWKTACADCHSNESVYPWYSYVAPVGWLVAHDVHEGRDKMNVSVNHHVEFDDMAEEIEEGGMPLPIYLPMHPDANLTDAQRTQLISGLRATFGGSASVFGSNNS
jgi:mono/diheme cytochrome c family protein